MATKWADYLISAVEYNSTGSHIARVRAHPDNGDTVGAGAEMQRSTVVSWLESGTTFATITRNTSDNKWTRGADVRVVVIDDTKYIRTDPDRTKSDNLGQLLRF